MGAALSIAIAAAAYGWLRLMEHRNRHIRRPPLTSRDGLPYPASEITYSDGETVDYVDVGRGPAIVMVPGADGIKETFRYQIPDLAPRYRVVVASLRERFRQASTFDCFSDDLVELCDSLRIESAVFVGQSLGGAIVLRHAVRNPDRVRGIAAANSLARVSYEHVRLNRTLLAPVAMFTTRYLPTALARRFARMWSRLEVWLFDASPGWARVVEYALWTGPRTVSPKISGARVNKLKGEDLRPQLPSVRAPTIVIKGPRDHYTPPAWAEEIARLIPGARYATVPGTGHCSHISMPDDFNSLLLGWLDGPEFATPRRGHATVERSDSSTQTGGMTGGGTE